jgi:anti-sigma B factor antagonist
MKIESIVDDSVTIIALVGRFDASVVTMFKKFVDDLETKEQANYVVDLAEVDYIDSGGLGCLVSFLRRVRQNDGDIKVSTLSDKVRSVFEITRLHRIFEIYDERSAAVRSFATN